jgi:hypothetical protein
MNRTFDDEIEADLRDLFDRQARALHIDARTWDDAPMVAVDDLGVRRRPRSAIAAIVSLAAAVALVVGIVAIAPGDGVHVAGRPGLPAAIHLATKQVSLRADSMSITAGGRHFTAGGSTVDLNSDPGTRNKYTTIELVWNEGGTEMRLNIYFTSDGHDWWAKEIMTYNGKSPGDWIDYRGVYFRTPLGTAFTGNVDLAATDAPGRLQFSNLQLQPFLPPAVCKNATTRYAFDIAYDHANMPDDRRSGFGLGQPTLLDTTTCTQVSDSHAFVYDLKLTSAGVAAINTAYGSGHNHVVTAQHDIDPQASIDLASEGRGSTTLRVTARSRARGQVVATTEIPVTVG